jgi:hypothetical protein
MATMNVSLPDEIKAFVEARATEITSATKEGHL